MLFFQRGAAQTGAEGARNGPAVFKKKEKEWKCFCVSSLCKKGEGGGGTPSKVARLEEGSRPLKQEPASQDSLKSRPSGLQVRPLDNTPSEFIHTVRVLRIRSYQIED